MVAYAHPHYLNRRQSAPPPIPSISGIGQSSIVVSSTVVTGTLAFDTSASPGAATPPPITVTVPSSSTPTSSSTASSSASATVEASSSSSRTIPLGTVIGSCVGAFIGAAALIILAVWIYRRYSNFLKKAARSRKVSVSHADGLNARSNQQRRRSRLEPWNKLEEGDDRWEDMYRTKEVNNIAPMEKLTMFKKSPSVRTAYTHKSEEPVVFDLPHSFAQFQGKDLSTDVNDRDMPARRPFLGRADVGPAISWDDDTVGKNSYLSIPSNQMSPSLAMAIPTPPATSSEPHRWESAEVVHYQDNQSTTDVTNPFVDVKDNSNNPFFNNQDYASRSQPISHTRETSNYPPSQSSKSKGKQRAIETHGFDETTVMSRPSFVHHVLTESASSVATNDRAIQSLIAVLDVSEADVHDRLRVASMQPSILSTASTYTSGGEDEDVSTSFPLPPHDENQTFRA